MKQFKYSFGVTLIELVVVLSIIAILAAIGIPSYQTYLIESRRSDAINALQHNQLLIENYIQKNGVTPSSSQVALLTVSQEGFYNLSYDQVDTSNYKIVATADSTKSQNNDTGCTVISIINQMDTIYPAYCH
jgi:type IV pilus assembly protein PilE